MKKIGFIALQLLSMFLFVCLMSGIYNVFKEVVENDKDTSYNLGYCVGAIIAFGILFWLNIKLYKFTTRKISNTEAKSDS